MDMFVASRASDDAGDVAIVKYLKNGHDRSSGGNEKGKWLNLHLCGQEEQEDNISIKNSDYAS